MLIATWIISLIVGLGADYQLKWCEVGADYQFNAVDGVQIISSIMKMGCNR